MSQVLLLILEWCTIFLVGLAGGLAFGCDVRLWAEQNPLASSMPRYWTMVKRNVWLSQAVGWSLLSCLTRSAFSSAALDFLGLLVGVTASMLGRRPANPGSLTPH